MLKFYVITKEALPVPGLPLGQGHTDRGLTLSGKADEYVTAAEALARARTMREQGYRVSMRDPEGREWTHAEIFAEADRGTV
jgi:hypothetical protein